MNHCVLLRAEASVIAGVGRCSGHFHLQAVGEHAPSSQEVLRKPLAVGDFSLALAHRRSQTVSLRSRLGGLPSMAIGSARALEPWRPGAVPPKCADAALKVRTKKWKPFHSMCAVMPLCISLLCELLVSICN